MHIDVYVTPVGVTDMALQNYGVIVIDILRAGTTMCQALKSGCREIVPVATIEHAMNIAGNLFRDNTLLCGEREGRLIRGFDLGNSPFEYTPERVKGKSLIMTTTNGTVALDKARRARHVIMGAFVNFSAVINTVRTWGCNVTILCSGRNGRMSLEDMVAAGMFVTRIKEACPEYTEETDTAAAAVILYQKFAASLENLVRNTVHGKYLESIEFGKDVVFCAQIDTIPVVPTLKDASVIGSDSPADV